MGTALYICDPVQSSPRIWNVARIATCGRPAGPIVLRCLAWACLALITPSLTAAQSTVSRRTRQGGVVTDSLALHGSVTEGRNHPIVGARVTVRQFDGVFADSVLTDSSGQYRIAVPEASRSKPLLVTVTASGFAPGPCSRCSTPAPMRVNWRAA